jgi:hypothetical protein
MAAMSTLNDLPYAREYIRDILRPRVEKAIQTVDRSMTESVWQHVVRMLVAEQPSGDAQSPAMIRKLLEDSLGLKMTATLAVSIDDPIGAATDHPEVVVRSKSLPLVGAVLASDRPR